MASRTVLVGMFAMVTLLSLASSGLPTEPLPTPPASVQVEPLPTGGALNVSWEPQTTNASTFHVYLVVDDLGHVPVGTASATAPWFIHTGLADGETYSYVVVSDDASGRPASAPSPLASGVPGVGAEVPIDEGSPVLHPLPAFTNEHLLNVSGLAPTPGNRVEVEVVPILGGMSSNLTTTSDPLTGEFDLTLTLVRGTNIVHARCLDAGDDPGPWSAAHNVILDILPPVLRISGEELRIERGAMAYLSTEGTTDDTGISRTCWRIGSEPGFELDGPVFMHTFNETGRFNVTVEVSDLAGNTVTETVPVVVVPFNAPPRFVGLPRTVEVGGHGKLRLDLGAWVEDVDDPTSSLVWFVSGGNDTLFTTALEDGTLVLMGMGRGGGEALLSLYVADPHGQSTNGTLVVSVARTEGGERPVATPLALIATCSAITAGAGVLLLRRRTRPSCTVATPGLSHFFVKGIYLIHNDGRLIKSQWSVNSALKDPEMVGSMFTAIQDFVCNSFEGSGNLESVMFGNDHLTVARGNHVYIATLSLGPVGHEYVSRAVSTVRRIEAEYAGIIEDWDGSGNRLREVEPLLAQLLEFNSGRSIEEVARQRAPSVIELKPTLEFQHGLVCYRLNVTNHSDTMMVDASVTFEWDHDVLHLKSVSPAEERFGGRVHIGNLDKGGHRLVELCFDPQTCLESYIRGVMGYMDVRGRLHTLNVESMLIDVNCPIFFTVGNANTAMLHRLVGELEHKDNRVLRFARVLEGKLIFKLARSVVAGYDVTFVQEFTSEDPFIGEAWYYGETKIHDYRVVVRVTYREPDSTLEFFVAATHATTIVGLLAELKRLFLMRIDELYPGGVNAHRIMSRSVKEDLREDYLNRPTLYELAVTGAADKREALKRDLVRKEPAMACEGS